MPDGEDAREPSQPDPVSVYQNQAQNGVLNPVFSPDPQDDTESHTNIYSPVSQPVTEQDILEEGQIKSLR